MGMVIQFLPLTQANSVWAPPDYANTINAMHKAITPTGHGSEGDLSDPDDGWLHLTSRGYAVVPIWIWTPSSLIIGAVGISSEVNQASGGEAGFISTVDR